MPFFTGASGRSYYRNWGISAPRSIVLFLHGAGEHSGHYHRMAGALNAAGIEVWAPDHIGHGLTEGERGGILGIPQLAANARVLLNIIRAARPGLPIVLAGHSLGGVTAAYMLTRRTKGVAGAILTGSPLKPGPMVLPASFDVTRDPFFIDMLDTDPLAAPFPPERVAERRRLMAAVCDDMAERLAELGTPILLINGTDDPIAPADYAEGLAGRLQNARSLIYPDACHDIINDTCFERVQADMVDFVRDVAA